VTCNVKSKLTNIVAVTNHFTVLCLLMTLPLYAELLSVDAHGPLDIVSERAWSNVKLNQHRSQATAAAETQPVYLQGADLNCLLRGAFTLLGSGALLDTDLPGGVFPWEVVLGTIMATLRHLCSVEDVTRRIDHLLCSYLHHQQSAVPIAQSLLSRDNDNHSQHGRLLHGSFSFLCYWAHSFHGHLSDIDVFKLHHAVIRFSSQLPKRIQSESASHVEYDRISSRVVDCQLVVSSLLALRTNVSLGRHPTQISNYWSPSGRTNTTPTGRTNNASSVCDEWLGGFHPDVDQLEGTWSGLDVSSAGNQLKELLTQSAPIKIEIFGGDMILGD